MEDEQDETQPERDEVVGEHETRYVEFEQYLAALPSEPHGAGCTGWSLLGKVVAVVLICVGLGMIGYMVLIMVALNSWGSNK